MLSSILTILSLASYISFGHAVPLAPSQGMTRQRRQDICQVQLEWAARDGWTNALIVDVHFFNYATKEWFNNPNADFNTDSPGLYIPFGAWYSLSSNHNVGPSMPNDAKIWITPSNNHGRGEPANLYFKYGGSSWNNIIDQSQDAKQPCSNTPLKRDLTGPNPLNNADTRTICQFTC